MDNTKLIELVITRISHDLIGNIGAVSNALELMEEDDIEFLDDIKSILKISSTNLSARMKFFRLAFGLNNANLSDANLVKDTTQNYLNTIGNPNQKILLDLQINSAALAKISMVSAMILADCLIRGGEISIKQSDEYLLVTANSATNIPASKIIDIKDALDDKPSDNMAQLAPVYLLKNMVKELGINIQTIDDNNFGFKIY